VAFSLPQPIDGRGTNDLPFKTGAAHLQVLSLIQSLEFDIHRRAEAFGTNLVEEIRQP